jgi:predicted small integral membrane protein
MAWTWPTAALFAVIAPALVASTILPYALMIWFVRNHVAKGFALGTVK